MFVCLDKKRTSRPAKASCLIFLEFVTLVRDEMRYFKNWSLSKSLVFLY